ncbi:hypothetical protein [uncultured Stenotrophomonas sp.]|uniref:hypothetical protein n=1 Tax=uncultured Stenotrophomonas sp. TaxID=165438 RepID=UPI0025CF7C89|nr:hypothetical protein [uncultured Stenotrophomonas sp.]
MAQQVIDTTTDHGTYKGDPAKVAFEKVNANDAELYGLVTGLAAVGGENMLINCGVPINQRGFAGGALAAGAYGYDRWKAGSGGCNVSINATTGVFTHTSGPLQQIIEAPVVAWGLPLTISVENPSGNIAVNVGGATGTITAGTGRRGVTLTPTGSGNMTVQLTAAGVTYSRPKLEMGSSSTPFQVRSRPLEMMLCRRYYETSFNDGLAPGTGRTGHAYQGSGYSSSSVRITEIPFKVRKRSAPSVTPYTDNLAGSQQTGMMSVFISGSYASFAVVGDANQINVDGWSGDMNLGSGITAGSSYLVRGNWAADAEL